MGSDVSGRDAGLAVSISGWNFLDPDRAPGQVRSGQVRVMLAENPDRSGPIITLVMCESYVPY
jgi:hypothetical protein